MLSGRLGIVVPGHIKMDVSDQGTRQEEFAREAALSARKPQAEIYLTGACWNCETPADALFCSSECGADWKKRDDAEKRVGR